MGFVRRMEAGQPGVWVRGGCEFLGIWERWVAKVIPGVVFPVHDAMLSRSLCAFLSCTPTLTVCRPQGSLFTPFGFLLVTFAHPHMLKEKERPVFFRIHYLRAHIRRPLISLAS